MMAWQFSKQLQVQNGSNKKENQEALQGPQSAYHDGIRLHPNRLFGCYIQPGNLESTGLIVNPMTSLSISMRDPTIRQ